MIFKEFKKFLATHLEYNHMEDCTCRASRVWLFAETACAQLPEFLSRQFPQNVAWGAAVASHTSPFFLPKTDR